MALCVTIASAFGLPAMAPLSYSPRGLGGGQRGDSDLSPRDAEPLAHRISYGKSLDFSTRGCALVVSLRILDSDAI